MRAYHSFFLLQFTRLILISWIVLGFANAQGAKQTIPQTKISVSDADHIKERNEWFYRGRVVRGRPSAELRRRAYQAKLRLRVEHAAEIPSKNVNGQVSFSSGSWLPLGPAPLASDASGNGTQDYHQVAGRATAIAIDPADSTGNTVYIGGAQSGIWKSTNAADPIAGNVTWTPISDDQATLSIGAIVIQPGNTDPTKTVILADTGEADNSGDSYFGLGILRSTDAGNSWSLISSANNGALSFAGLGGTRMAFSTAAGQTNTVIAAMATTNEGLTDGAVTSNTTRGLYTSVDAGQTWNYNALVDPGGSTDATSATSIVFNPGAGQFFAAVRFHGFYSSIDGTHWTRLANQPGGSVLSTAACPPQSTSNNYGCPIYRGEITVVPGRNEMYAWYIYFSSTGSVVDGGVWQSLNGGASWTSISDAGITNCGDLDGCGAQQGDYNLELLAVPNCPSGQLTCTGNPTDLYAGTINLYKCSLPSSSSPACTSGFLNLTHVYGCAPIAAPSHVHPDQHALAYMIPTSGTDSGNALMYFANDGGIYRALDGYLGLNTGVCSGMNAFDDLNENLGSMTQFVSFSEHPTDPDTILGGSQDNGSPATNQATTNPSWVNVLGGDGGYNAIDPTATSNWYASNPDIPVADGGIGLGIQLCSNGVNCNNGGFSFVVTGDTVGGDDGPFYFPYILDPRSLTAMLVGTCRVWRGPRAGGMYSALSPNFDTLGSGTCSGREINQVRALAAAGQTDNNGSSVIYATTSGLGPVDGPLYTPSGGHVWVTTDASAGTSAFNDVTNNGPQGSINPNQFPISGVATDSSDSSGNTAYVTVMGFTGGTGHVWKTTNAGSSWTDFTGNLPDSPVNAVVVYPPMSQVFVATDVGVFASSTTAPPNWTELGPNPNTDQFGFLPNVAVTSLGIFASGGKQLLRASTYGRGIWQFNLTIVPDFTLSVTDPVQTAFVGQTATFDGTASALDGYTSSVTLSCTSVSTGLTCNPSPTNITPANKTPFTVVTGGKAGDYNFNVQAAGSDSKHVTKMVALTLHLIDFGLTKPTPEQVTVPRGTTSSSVSFQITAAGSFNQSVSVSCTTDIPGANPCLPPGTTVNPTSQNSVKMMVSVDVPATTAAGSYTATIQATTAGAPSPLTASFTLNVTTNPDFVLDEPSPFPEVNVGSTGVNGPISITSQDQFSGTVTLSCPNTFGAGSCSINPTSVSSFPATATLTIDGTSFTAGAYTLSITGTSGSVTHSRAIPFNVGDYSVSGNQNVSAVPGGQATVTLKLTSLFSYTGTITATCDASSLSGSVCTPSSPITLSSGGTANLTVVISVPNNANPGAYTFTINTEQETTGAPAHSASVSVTVGQDFSLTTSTQSQTIPAGQTTSGPYNLTVQPVGQSFNGNVSLSCSGGLPSGAQCLFNPSTPVTPGNSAVDVVMSISITRSNARWPLNRNWIFYALLLPAIVVAGTFRKRSQKPVWPLLMATFLLLWLAACGGTSGPTSTGGGSGSSPTTPTIYQVTVTGASQSPAQSHTVIVTLIVD